MLRTVERVHACFTLAPRRPHAGSPQSARVVRDTTETDRLMLLLALLASPRLTHVQIHRRVDDRFDLSDLTCLDGGAESLSMRASIRKRSAAVTERLPIREGE